MAAVEGARGTGDGRRPLAIVIAGGGTGGHLYPGIAVAREVMTLEPDASVTFVGTAAGIEARVIPREGFALALIQATGLKGKSVAARVRGLALLPLGARDAWRVLTERRPSVVVGVGGYSSGPVVLLAALRGIPTLLMEQNVVPGLTNRLLAPFVDAAAVTYEESAPFFRGKAFLAGNPVRREFLADENGTHSREGDGAGAAVNVLVFGGSQGSHALNVAMMEAAPRLAARGRALHLTHQTGERDLQAVRDRYREVGFDARVEPFLYEMDREMKAADVVVSRAGATTLAELTASGKASILVPLPTATDDHQRKNAEVLVARGAARMVLERDLSGERLAAEILDLAEDRERRYATGAAARTLSKPQAARLIADKVLSLAG
jgi:UDP-N-acetylglucosamine--N-acetylmuramyl-(pentapeptide) pyrophosphoryl-undecaprenol N-acetylglucosamine transferase